MMRIPKPDEAHDDLVRTIGKVAARSAVFDRMLHMEQLLSDAELERAGDMNQPVAVSAPSKDQHHCDS